MTIEADTVHPRVIEASPSNSLPDVLRFLERTDEFMKSLPTAGKGVKTDLRRELPKVLACEDQAAAYVATYDAISARLQGEPNKIVRAALILVRDEALRAFIESANAGWFDGTRHLRDARKRVAMARMAESLEDAIESNNARIIHVVDKMVEATEHTLHTSQNMAASAHASTEAMKSMVRALEVLPEAMTKAVVTGIEKALNAPPVPKK